MQETGISKQDSLYTVHEETVAFLSVKLRSGAKALEKSVCSRNPYWMYSLVTSRDCISFRVHFHIS